QAADGATLAWREDDFTDPWRPRETVLLLHGIGETGEAFRGWVPHLARRCRVVRADFRGYGASSRLPAGAQLSLETLAADTEALVAALGVARVHVVGAKLGAQVALMLAQRKPPWLASLSLAGVLISPGDALGAWVERWCAMVDEGGSRRWAEETMPGRMGGSFPAAAMEWWGSFMAEAPPETVKACLRMLPALREPARLEDIRCPTQVLVAVQPAAPGAFDQRQPVEEVRRWQQRIPGSRLCAVEADSYHIAASHPDACARIVAEFIGGLST
ncbi:MAG TPA: alpha/beta fold hydrolase, partial [Ramlibacter sp.]